MLILEKMVANLSNKFQNINNAVKKIAIFFVRNSF